MTHVIISLPWRYIQCLGYTLLFHSLSPLFSPPSPFIHPSIHPSHSHSHSHSHSSPERRKQETIKTSRDVEQAALVANKCRDMANNVAAVG